MSIKELKLKWKSIKELKLKWKRGTIFKISKSNDLFLLEIEGTEDQAATIIDCGQAYLLMLYLQEHLNNG